MNIFGLFSTPPKGEAEILGCADSSHYLVGISDLESSDVNYVKSRSRKLRYFNSLCEAKDFVSSLGYKSTKFRMQTPYDEMTESTCQDATISIPLTN